MPWTHVVTERSACDRDLHSGTFYSHAESPNGLRCVSATTQLIVACNAHARLCRHHENSRYELKNLKRTTRTIHECDIFVQGTGTECGETTNSGFQLKHSAIHTNNSLGFKKQAAHLEMEVVVPCQNTRSRLYRTLKTRTNGVELSSSTLFAFA